MVVSRLFLLISTVLLVAAPAKAACLLGDYSVKSEFERSIAVVIGTVVNERPTPESKDLSDGVTYTVRVEESLRGHVPATMELFSANSSAGFPMNTGVTYLLFLDQTAERIAADNCGNSGPISDKQLTLITVRRLAKKTLEAQQR